MRVVVLAGLALAAIPLAPTAAGGDGRPGCTLRGTHVYRHKSEMPRGALAALGFPMAERGEPFQVSDAIGPGPRLPFARFAAARLDGCTLAIRYEHGGIAHTWNTAIVERRGIAWVLVRPR